MDTATIQKMVRDWYHLLDIHEPMVSILPILADEGLMMKFPEATLHGKAQFEGWYQGVIRIFFDEVQADVTYVGEMARVDIIVHWEASAWNPPAARSKRIVLDAYQTWEVVAGPDGAPQVKTYIVDRLEYAPGSDTL